MLSQCLPYLLKDFARLSISDCVITGYYLNITTNRKNRNVTKQNNTTTKIIIITQIKFLLRVVLV